MPLVHFDILKVLAESRTFFLKSSASMKANYNELAYKIADDGAIKTNIRCASLSFLKGPKLCSKLACITPKQTSG